MGELGSALSGIAAIIAAVSGLITAIIAYKNSKQPTPPPQPMYHLQPQPDTQANTPPPQPQQTAYVQGVPQSIQPKTYTSTGKLAVRFGICFFGLVFLGMISNSMTYASEADIIIGLVALLVMIPMMIYGVRLLYRGLIKVFLH